MAEVNARAGRSVVGRRRSRDAGLRSRRARWRRLGNRRGGADARWRRGLGPSQVRPHDRQPSLGAGRLRGRVRAHGVADRQSPICSGRSRGGGGNFGIVTSFEFRAHPLGPIVAFAGVFYPVADAPQILPRWRDYCVDAPDEVTSVALAITMPAAPHLPRGDSQPGLPDHRRRVRRRRPKRACG